MPGGNRGFELRSRPRSYRMTEQQKNFREALATCNIHKGITRHDLVDRMVNCLPTYFRQLKEQEGAKPPAPPVKEAK